MRCFITGTDTGVGKSIVSAWLAIHFQASYWKPIQCGSDRDTALVASLSGRPVFPERYCLQAPRSPQFAAAVENCVIKVRDFQVPASERLIVEGAGGVLVPLNDRETMVDLMQALGLPVIVVARGTLGSVNHTLLTLEALQRRKIPLLGVIFSGDVLPENPLAVTEHSGVPVLAQLPHLMPLSYDALAAYILPELLDQVAKEPLP